MIQILRQVCESLEEAHSAGLVHRDIKPANIHLGRVGRRDDFVKVLDFGLVRSIAGPSEESLTGAAGITPGTPAYMAPEMAHDRAVDGRADLYSLGCVAYYLLTGHLVFEGETPLQTILKHLQQPPEPPSSRTDRPIPAELETLVLAYYDAPDLARFAEVGEGAPELWEKFFAWYDAVFADGALSAREKSIIALAVAHAVQCPYCIDAYTATRSRRAPTSTR